MGHALYNGRCNHRSTEADPIDRAQILARLKSTFGYDSFRPLQEEIVRALLEGQDVFALMPTGGGKSLCYQLPVLLRDGLAVVVSPLIALMKDQVDALTALGIPATYINSLLDQAEIGRRQAAVARGEVKLLYVAPERLMLPGFLGLLSRQRLAYFAIDEAHCISEWGHDFRPAYLDLARLRDLFPGTTLGAFTATATRRVQADIKAHLGLENAASFRGSFNRANLFYEVRPKKAAYRQLVAYLHGRGRVAGIVYCQSRESTEKLAARLRGDGFSAAAYHAGLENEERRRTQDAFIKDDIQIIVATIAFGMGIDKPDVRFVVHYDLPRSLEGYYQESGRAGRDGEPSDCLLFYTYADVAKQQYFIAQKPSAAERRVAQQQLRRMVEWASGTSCRRRALLAYFDEPLAEESDRCCDICRAATTRVDLTIPAQMFLSCAKRTGECFGSAHLIAVLRGSRGQRLRQLGHDRLSTYGIGRDRSAAEWQHLVAELLRAGYVRQDHTKFNAVRVTERGEAVLFHGERALLAPPPDGTAGPGRAAAVPGLAQSDGARAAPTEEIFAELRALRKRLADERRVPPYVIFADTTLRQMASTLPTTREGLRRIPGVGERKLEDLGDAFLACIRSALGLPQPPPAAAPAPPGAARPTNGLSPSAATSLEMFEQGHSLAEIASTRGLALTTVEEHLAEAIAAGILTDLDRLVAADKRQRIEETMAELGAAFLAPIRQRLGDAYTYGELRFVRAALRRTQ